MISETVHSLVMSNFSTKKIAACLLFVLGSYVVGGAILDTIGNALSLINWAITIVGSILLIILWLSLNLLLNHHPVSWGQYNVKKLGIYPLSSFIGIALLLWTPPFLILIGYPIKNDTVAEKKEPVENSQPNEGKPTINETSNVSGNFTTENKSNEQTKNINQSINTQSNSDKIISTKINPDKPKISTNTKLSRTPIPQSLRTANRLIAQGKYKEAIVECDRILRINPNNSEAKGLKRWSQQRLEILDK